MTDVRPLVGIRNELPTILQPTVDRVLLTSEFQPGDRLIALKLLSEATVKLIATCSLAVARMKGDQFAEYLEKTLARANSLGTWVQVLRQAATMPAWIPPHWQSFNDFLLRKHKLVSTSDEAFPAAWAGFEELRALLGETPETYPATTSYISLLEFLVRFRNSSPVGHGAQGEEWTRSSAHPLEALLTGILSSLVSLPYTFCVLYRDEGGLVAQCLQPPLLLTRLHADGPPASTPGSVTLRWTGESSVDYQPLPRFVVLDPDTREAYFHNGAVNTQTGKAEYICYASGRTAFYHFPELAGEVPQLPQSETAAASRISRFRDYSHNLPGIQPNYVSRPGLESKLLALLQDKTHRIVTLHGEGGTGKTSLALHMITQSMASHALSASTILWFSARDIDLVTEGPKYRKRDVSDLQGILLSFVSFILEETVGVELAQEIFCDAVTGKDKYILIMDNFETFEDPKLVYDFLDHHVVLPSKVLITSREREFVGDFAVGVDGMYYDEAKELILRASRESLCEPSFAHEAATRKVWDVAGGNPYQMKLLVGLVAGGTRLDTLAGAIGGRTDVLEALFRRSYDKLSRDGEWLYLVLGGLNVPLPSIAAEVVLDGREIEPGIYFSTNRAVQELQRYALLSDMESVFGGALLSLPHVSSKFSRRVSASHPFSVEIARDIEELRKILRPGINAAEPEAMLGLLQRHAYEKYYEKEDLVALALRLCERYPELWRKTADWFSKIDVDRVHVRDALHRALEDDPANTDILLQLAAAERALGSKESSLGYEVRAAELQADNPKLIIKVAVHVNEYAADQGKKWPVHRRATFCDLLAGLLEPYRVGSGLATEEGLAALAELKVNLFNAEVPETMVQLEDAVSVAMEGVHGFTRHEASEKILRRAENLLRRYSR